MTLHSTRKLMLQAILPFLCFIYRFLEPIKTKESQELNEVINLYSKGFTKGYFTL